MRRVALIVTGGIAAYRSCDLIGRLRERGVETRVAMTGSATKFITPLTFAALTGHPVLVNELTAPPEPIIRHIELARYAELVLVAPATADFLARVAHGMGDDGPTATLLALDRDKKVLFCPAMNTAMWENPFVQDNVRRIKEVGGADRYRFLDPAEKRLACGEVGAGGMPETADIVDACFALL